MASEEVDEGNDGDEERWRRRLICETARQEMVAAVVEDGGKQ